VQGVRRGGVYQGAKNAGKVKTKVLKSRKYPHQRGRFSETVHSKQSIMSGLSCNEETLVEAFVVGEEIDPKIREEKSFLKKDARVWWGEHDTRDKGVKELIKTYMRDENGRSTLLFRPRPEIRSYNFGTTSMACAMKLIMRSIWRPCNVQDDRMVQEVYQRMKKKIDDEELRAKEREQAKAEKKLPKARTPAAGAAPAAASMFAKAAAASKSKSKSTDKAPCGADAPPPPQPPPPPESTAKESVIFIPEADIAGALEMGLSEALLRDATASWEWLGPTMPSGPLARLQRWLVLTSTPRKRTREEVVQRDFLDYFAVRQSQRDAERLAEEKETAKRQRADATLPAPSVPVPRAGNDSDEQPAFIDEEAEFQRLRALAKTQTKKDQDNIEFAAWEREHGLHAVAHRRIIELGKKVPRPNAPLVMKCTNCDATPIEQFMECSCSRDWYVCNMCNSLCEKVYAPCMCSQF
jgi:hypothetical protein